MFVWLKMMKNFSLIFSKVFSSIEIIELILSFDINNASSDKFITWNEWHSTNRLKLKITKIVNIIRNKIKIVFTISLLSVLIGVTMALVTCDAYRLAMMSLKNAFYIWFFFFISICLAPLLLWQESVVICCYEYKQANKLRPFLVSHSALQLERI